MKLFKKTQKINEDKSNQEIIKNDIEILDFDSKESKVETKKENKLLLIIMAILILIVILLPTITGWFNKTSIFSYTQEVEEIINKKTVDGMLEIGKEEGSITVKNIRFYNPAKKSNNMIGLVYLPETGIKNVNDMNIYIELYNSNKSIIYRQKFESDEKLERRVQGTINFSVNEMIYKEAYYAKITIIKEDDFKGHEEKLICTQNTQIDEKVVESKITYEFGKKGLISYVVNKIVKIDPTDTIEETTNKGYFDKEAEIISKTNTKDLVFDDISIEYRIDIQNLKLGKSDYQLLYNLGTVKRQVKLGEESKQWSCK